MKLFTGLIMSLSDWCVSYRFTTACRHGLTTILTTRCDLQQSGNGTIDLPSKCPDGTCDGCVYMFMWKSQFACPRCDEDSFTEVVEECSHGKQKIVRIKPKYNLLLTRHLIFSRPLQCNARLILSLIICCLSVCLWRECIVTKLLQLGSGTFHWNVAQCLNSLPAKFDDKIRRGPLDLGTQTGVGLFLTSRCFISETVRDRASVTINH